MIHKKTKNAKKVFSIMVPLTLVAFYCACQTVGIETVNYLMDWHVYDILGLIIVAVGVFMYNWYDEKPQKASVEHF